MTGHGQLGEWLDRLASLGGIVNAAETAIVARGTEGFRHATGFRVGGERLRPRSEARFDAASLSKPWFATLALALDANGALALETPIGAIVDLAPALPLATRTLEDLLRHRSGLPAWTPLGVRLGSAREDPRALLELLVREPPVVEPGTVLYSDLGYILWGLLAEAATGRPIADLLDEHVCPPLGLAPLGALAADPPRPVECRLDNGREVELAEAQGIRLGRQHSFHLGRAQDGNARAHGRLCAHAGLFVTVDEMLALASEWLRPERLLTGAAVERALAGNGTRALGWVRAAGSRACGAEMSESAFGHTGFTGGSLWIDPERDRIELLLAHRLASKIDFDPFRSEFHRLAAAIENEEPGADGPTPEDPPTTSKKLE